MIIFAAIKVRNGTDSGIGTSNKDAQESCQIKPCAIGRTCWRGKDRDLRHRKGEGICTIGYPAKDSESAEHTDTIEKPPDGESTRL